jgi:hypothetical protein
MIMTEPVASPYAASPLAAIPSPVASPAAAPAAARRSGKAGGGVDLFAPGQRHQEPAAAAAPSTATTSADRLVGERNENSVLFSISALTASAGAGKKNDDPFNLSAPSAPRNGRGNVDDIMNLGGGMSGPGMSAPMLAPPPLLAPVVEAPPPPPQRQAAPVAPMPAMNMNMGAPAVPMVADQYPRPKSKMPLILGIVAGVALLGGAGAFFATRGGSPAAAGPDSATATATATAAPTTPPTTGTTVAAPTPTQTAAPTPADTAKPADTGTQSPTTPANAAGANAGKAPVGGPVPGKNDSKPAPDKPADTKPADTPKPPDPPKPADTKPADTGGGGKEFDRGAASAALGAASGAARGCKKEDGPTGTARVSVTFAPSGSVSSSSVDGPPFAGTSVGGCIAAAFRGAHVPAFDGSPVTVHKSVSIN